MNREILRLALPAIVSNITVPLLGMVDLAIVGHMGSESYIGAIAVGSMIFNVMYWLMGFLRMGSSGLTAQAVGRKDKQEIADILRTTLITAFVIGISFVVLHPLLRPLLLWLMQVSEENTALVSTYYNICIWGAVAVLGQYGLTGWFIGMQNTRIPMTVAIVQNVTNILLSVAFVYVFGMKIEGVALGTVLSQWVAFGLALYKTDHIAIQNGLFDMIKKPVLFNRKALFVSGFGKVNRDIFMRTLCLVAVNMYFTSAGSAQGTQILAINTLLMTLFTIFSYIMDGLAYAGEAVGGRLYGERNYEMLQRFVIRLMVWGLISAGVFVIAYLLGGKMFLGLLTDRKDVVDGAEQYLLFAVIVPAVSFVAFLFDGVFIGLTMTRQMLCSCAVAMVVFFAVQLSLVGYIGNNALWIAYLLFLAVRGGAQQLMWKRKAEYLLRHS